MVGRDKKMLEEFGSRNILYFIQIWEKEECGP
jgi:hypothetical protein